MLVRIMVRSIMNVKKLSTMSQGPNNFLNKEAKNKINYTRYIFLEKKKKTELHLNEIIANVIFWDLDTGQIIATYSHLNKISIISSIASDHKITQSLLVIYLFIILKKVRESLPMN